MKTFRNPSIIAAAAFMSFVSLQAEEPVTLDNVIAQRDALLTQLLDAAQSGLKKGTAHCTDVYDATVELYTFRRESAKNLEEKKKWQKELVAKAQEYAADCKKRVAIGAMNNLDHTRASERALAAQQLLLELEATK
jgi:hypothetical protein